MKRLKESEIPILPMTGVMGEESVAFGAGEPGVIIQFIDRDECILIEWYDMVAFGIELIKANPVKDTTKDSADAVEIPNPTVIR